MSIFLNIFRCFLCCEEDDPRPYRQDHDVTRSIRNRFQNPTTTTTTTTTTTDYTQVSHYDPLPSIIANSTRNYSHFPRPQSPISSVASNFPHTSTTPSFAEPKTESPKRPPQVSYAYSTTHSVVQPKTETPKRQPQVSYAYSTTHSVVKPKTETPKRQPQVPDANSTTAEKPLQKSSPKLHPSLAPRPYRQDHDVTRSIRNRFQNSTTNDYNQVPHYDPLPSIIANSTRNYSHFPRPQSPISSVASNFPHTSTTSSVAKPKTENPKRPPQFSYAYSTTHSVVQPKTETPKRQPQVPDANSTTDEKPLQKSSPKPPPSLAKPLLSSTKSAPSLSRSDLSSVSSSSSIGIPQLSIKPTLSQAPFNPTVPQMKTNYVWVEKGATPLYMIPEDIKGLIEKDIVPGVLKKPLSLSTYTDYFAALLYAEDYYLEKWDGFEMKDVSLQLHKAAIYGWKNKNKHLNRSDKKDDKIFVAFEIDSVPERRPFLLSRDFASVRPSGTKVEPFQGIIYRVVRSNLVLVEFGEDFYFQHYSACKYDVKFSFNRVCLKRAHQAIAAASDVLFRKFIFPERIPNINPITTEPFVNHKLDREQVSAVCQILRLQHPPPYLVEGPLSVINSKGGPRDSKQLSRTGVVIREAVLQICRTIPSSRVLICAPLNSTCDLLMRSLQMGIPESDMFRANAAFREIDGVPIDILPSCLYKGECFACPLLTELKKYKVILSTFMSSFRLRGEGIVAGHFSHIFLVDASCATEPETMVPLANLANERTAVVITGAPKSRSGWVRSNIARQNGLMRSYFERLRESKVYKSLDSKYITQLKDEGWKSDDRYNSPSFI